jgi:hypothetical protein
MAKVDTQEVLPALGVRLEKARLGRGRLELDEAPEGTWEGIKDLYGDLSPRPPPPPHFCSVFVPCAVTCGSCVVRRSWGWGEGEGGREGRVDLFCLQAFSCKFLSVHLSLSSLCPASAVCPSVCLSGLREGEGILSVPVSGPPFIPGKKPWD